MGNTLAYAQPAPSTAPTIGARVGLRSHPRFAARPQGSAYLGKHRQRAPRGSGSLRQRRDGTWEKRVSLRHADGTRYQGSAYGRTPEEAVQKAAILALNRGAKPSSPVSLDAHLRAWVQRKRAEWAGATYLLYRGYVERLIIPALGNAQLERLAKSDVVRFRDQLEADGFRAPTIDKVLKTLKAGLNDAIERDLVKENVAARVRSPRIVPAQKHILTLDEAVCLLDTARESSPYYALFVLAICAGMREGELFALDWEQVDLSNAHLDVIASLGVDQDALLIRKATKNRRSRRIMLPKMAVGALHALGQSSRPVFSDSHGGRLRKSNFLRREFHPLLARAGLPRITFHSLRHVANTMLLNEGEGIAVLQQRGGWSSARMPLDVYGHLLVSAQERAVNKIDALFAPHNS